MKRNIASVLAILAVAAGAGWNIARHPESSAGLQEISLSQHSEHSYPGQTESLARVRVRVSPDDLEFATEATAHNVRVRVSPGDLGFATGAAAEDVPRISVVAE
jgi:hypothetical protein